MTNDEQLLRKLEEFTKRTVAKYHKTGKSYLFDTRVLDDGLKIGSILISESNLKKFDLYDLTKRAYVYKDITNKSMAIAAAISYNRNDRSAVKEALTYDTQCASLEFEVAYFKILKKKTDDDFKKDLYRIKLLGAESRLEACKIQIQNHFQMCNLHK